MPANTSALINFAPVNAPPAHPPLVGLVAAAKLLGPEFLVEDEIELVDNGDGSGNGEVVTQNGTQRQMGVRWQMGYRYAPEQMCLQGGVMDPYSMGTMTVPAEPAIVVGQPKLVWAGDICSTFGWSARDYVGRATRALLASESNILAREFWTGTLAKAEHWDTNGVAWLASPSAIDVSNNTPQTPSTALNLLEQGISDTSNGQLGMIYCTRQLGSALSELGNTFRNVNGQIVTYMGTVICPDSGFHGTSPSGAAPTSGNQWAYATLLPHVRRSAITVVPDTFEEAIDRGGINTGLQNSLAFRAYRYMDATFPPCTLIACNVNLPLLGGGLS